MALGAGSPDGCVQPHAAPHSGGFAAGAGTDGQPARLSRPAWVVSVPPTGLGVLHLPPLREPGLEEEAHEALRSNSVAI